MMIQPIVEGHAEIVAVPILFRRLLGEVGRHEVKVAKPIKRNRTQFARRGDVQNVVELALTRPECRAIVFIFDADDDCPMLLAHDVKIWAVEAAAGRAHCEVVIVNREYEAWFLGSIEALRGHRGVKPDASYDGDCEGCRGAKEAFARLCEISLGYQATTDQPALTELIDFDILFRRARSFRHMIRAFNTTLAELGFECSFPFGDEAV